MFEAVNIPSSTILAWSLCLVDVCTRKCSIFCRQYLLRESDYSRAFVCDCLNPLRENNQSWHITKWLIISGVFCNCPHAFVYVCILKMLVYSRLFYHRNDPTESRCACGLWLFTILVNWSAWVSLSEECSRPSLSGKRMNKPLRGSARTSLSGKRMDKPFRGSAWASLSGEAHEQIIQRKRMNKTLRLTSKKSP